MFFSNINLVTVFGASVVGLIIGFVWYSPWAFGKVWLKTKSWSDHHMQEKKAKQSMVAVYLTNFVSTLVTAFILGALFNSLIVTTFTGIVLTGFFLWVAFAVPVKLVDYLFGGDTAAFFFVNIGYWLVEIVAMSLIIGLFS